jgi:teichuronic acid biosynthesis glycosyltransferase TuaG
MTALVSIIMPVFNAAPYVLQAIESALSQSYPHWELIIVNDGSTDDSEIKINAIQDERIRYFYQNNGGVSQARNKALEEMRGEYFCFLDADDVLPPESIASRLEYFQRNSTLVAVDGTVEVYDMFMHKQLRTWRPVTHGPVTRSLYRLTGDCFFGITWMIKIDHDKKYRFDEDMTHAEDLLFFAEISTTGNYGFVEQSVYKCRISPNSAMTKTDDLALGYQQYFKKATQLLVKHITLSDTLTLLIRIRKIIFLTYFREQKKLKALYYLIAGSAYP